MENVKTASASSGMHQHKRTVKAIFILVGIVLGVIFLFPILILILNSFKSQKGIFLDILGFPSGDIFCGTNYLNAFELLDYVQSFMNSLVITVVSTILILLVSAMAAWVLVRYKTKSKRRDFHFICSVHAGSVPVRHAAACTPEFKAEPFEPSWVDFYVHRLWLQYVHHYVSRIY
jgi:ABC-type glycerol-3-phosphate transport system permease component